MSQLLTRSQMLGAVFITALLGGLIGWGLVSGSVAEQKTNAPSVENRVVVDASAIDAAAVSGHPAYRFWQPSKSLMQYDEFKRALPVTEGENIALYDAPFQTKMLTINIPVGGETEYKAIMDSGDTLLYSWKVVNGDDVYFDFHAHQDGMDEEFFTRYSEGEKSIENGAIVAPYSGQHGWYWLNISEQDITIELNVSGEYKDIVHIFARP